MPKGDAFKKADEAAAPPKFDLRRWIDRGKMRLVKSVDVYLAPGLEADILELDAQIASTQTGPADDRLGVVSPLVDLAQRREALAAEMEESRTTFQFRTLGDGELDKVRSENTPGEAEEFVFRLLAAQCIAPVGLSWEDFRDLYGALGDIPFTNTIVRAAAAARDGSAVDVPFSSRPSEILRTHQSSES